MSVSERTLPDARFGRPDLLRARNAWKHGDYSAENMQAQRLLNAFKAAAGGLVPTQEAQPRSERADALHGGCGLTPSLTRMEGELILSRLTGQPYCKCDVPKRRSRHRGSARLLDPTARQVRRGCAALFYKPASTQLVPAPLRAFFIGGFIGRSSREVSALRNSTHRTKETQRLLHLFVPRSALGKSSGWTKVPGCVFRV